MRRLPFITLAIVAGAAVIQWAPPVIAALQLERTALAHGELWRLLTAHLTHFNREHLLWDAAVFLILGVMAERTFRRRFAVCLVVAALAISLGVWWLQPQFTTYRGLSGLDSAVFGLVAGDLVRRGWRTRHAFTLSLATLTLVGFLGKCIFELVSGETVFVPSTGAFSPVPLAHLVGVATGLWFGLTARGSAAGPPAVQRRNMSSNELPTSE